MFLSRDSRPDIGFAVSHLARKMSNPTKKSIKMLNSLINWVKQNPLNIPLPQCHTDTSITIDAYVDASMGNHGDVKGQTGWVIFGNGFPLLWRTKKQCRVGRSSTKVEMIAMDDLLDSIELLCSVYKSIHIGTHVNIYTDSKDLLNLLEQRHPNPKQKSDSIKLIEIKQKLGTVATSAMLDTVSCIHSISPITVQHIPGECNPADALTKASARSSIDVLRNYINMRDHTKRKEKRERKPC